MQKKIAIVAPPTRPVPPVNGGGAQNVIYDTARHLTGFDLSVISVADPKLPLKHTENKIDYHHINIEPDSVLQKFLINRIHKPYRFYSQKAAEILNSIQPDIVHIHSNPWLVSALIPRLNFKPKVVLQHHNCPISRSFKTWELKRLMEKVDIFVGVSNFVVEEELTKQHPEYKAKCRVVYNAVDSDYFTIAQNKKSLRKIYNFPPDHVTIFFAGQIKPEKGIMTLLDSYEQLQQKYKGMKLLIAGSPSGANDSPTREQNDFYLKFLERLERLGDQVEYMQFLDKELLRSIYQLSDIFCAPSVMTEPFGLVIAEAMSCGLPVVASNRGGIPEVLGDCGILVFDPENAKELADDLEILMLSSDLRQEQGRRGRERVVDRFNYKKMAKAVEDIYYELLG